LDGVEEKRHGIIPEAAYYFTPDNRPAYVFEERRGIVAWVVGDVESKSYDNVWQTMWYSADGKRYAFVASDGKKLHVVSEGNEGPPFDNVRSLIFSRDGKRVMYAAVREGKNYLVLDGNETAYEEIYDAGFTPDS